MRILCFNVSSTVYWLACEWVKSYLVHILYFKYWNIAGITYIHILRLLFIVFMEIKIYSDVC